MTQEQKQVRDWMQAFGQATPSKPTIPDLATRKLRAKLILEEALEVVLALGIHIYIEKHYEEPWILDKDSGIKRLRFDRGAEPNLLEIADGCEDLKVVTEGTLVACGLVEQVTGPGCVDPLFTEVMRSNQSKLWTQDELFNSGEDYYAKQVVSIANPRHLLVVKDRDGKIVKPPSFIPPILLPIINSL